MAKGRQQYFADEVSIQKEAREFAIEEQLKAKIDSVEEGAQVNTIETVKVNGEALIPDEEKAVDVDVPLVEDNLYSVDTEAALSARQGKVLYEYIQNLQSRGRYLSNWNSATGLPTTNPSESPYVYRSGDYFLVSNVSTGTNYKPDGAQYEIGVASEAVETDTVMVSDMYIYDGANWQLIKNGERPIVIDDRMDIASTNPVENRVITQALRTKQNTISDLQTIREGAALGATSLQPGDSITELTGTSDDITEGTSHLFMTPQERTKLGNQTGVNTGDETQATIMAKLGAASATTNGYLTSADWSTFNNKQDAISDLQTIRDNAQAGKNASDTIATYGDIVTHNVSEFATATQGAKADTAIQPGDNVSELTNDAGYITDAYHDDTKQNVLTAGDNITFSCTIESDMKGPCPSGFHVPLDTEYASLITVCSALGIGGGNNFSTYLKFPFAGSRSPSSGSSSVTLHGSYWSSRPGRWLNVDSVTLDATHYANGQASGYSVRAIKNTPVVPDSSWTTLYDGSSIATGAGIFHNTTEGLISLSSDGTTWYTIMDKNLGATTVYNYGDTLTDANCGNLFQQGNNYGFPRTGTITKSSTQVDASEYGPGNYYYSDIFITPGNINWSSTSNDNAWGYVSQGTWEDCEHLTISATDTTYVAGDFDIKDLADSTGKRAEWDAKQDALDLGANLSWGQDGKLNATDTTYTAGPGISISANNVISNTQTSAEWGNIQGTLSNQTDLQNALNEKQGTLTAGDNITIDPATNTISAQVPDSAEWGNITGTLSNQTDLQTALNAKADATDINTKTFYLSSTSDLTTAQAAYDWYLAGKTPIIGWNGGTFILSRYDAPNISGALLKFREGYRKITGVWDNKYTAIGDGYVIRFWGSNDTVSQIDIGESMNYSYGYLSPGINYSNPYTPEYAGSPATKKYVDDAVAGAGGNYTAGNGIDITNNEISIDTSVVATQTDISNKVSKGINQSNGQLFSIENTYGFSNNFGPDYIRVDFNDGTNSGSAGIQGDSLGAMSNNETSNLDYERLLLRDESTMESARYQKDKIQAVDQNLDSEDYEFSGGGDNQIARLKDTPYVGTSAPSNPVEGRLWYDTTNDVLKSYDGTSWKEAGTQMKVLSYGHSTWQDFLNAYNENAVVYCRASSSSDPSTGSQGRLAFMAYVNNANNPTEVEFQYYRSRSDHNSAANQLDEVYVYKLVPASGGTWTVTQRNTGAKAVAGTGIGLSFGSGNMTISNSGVTSFNGDTGAITLTPGTYLSLNNNVIDVDTSLIATKADLANFAGFLVVAQLPTTDIKTNIIYLLGPVGTGADKYEEYIYSNNNWIMIGDTSIDLSPYFHKTNDDSDDIIEGSTNLFLTSAERTKLGNTSGTNSGDETKTTIQTKLGAASSSNSGYLTSADYDTLMAKADPSDVNTKTFYLQSTSDTTTAQAAIDWIRAGNTAILKLKVGNQDYYYYYSYADWSMTSVYHFVRTDNLLVGAVDGASTSHQKYSVLNISIDMTQSTPTVSSIYSGDTAQENFEVLRTGYNYATPYTPQYPGSPATKKYVDDSVASAGDMFYEDFEWSDNTGATVTLSLNTIVEPEENFTINAPSTIKDGQTYTLRANNGATAYTMTLGTNITNPYGVNTNLTANGIDQFVFLAIDGRLELQPDISSAVSVVSGDAGTTYIIKVSNTAPASGTASNIITLVP